MVLLLALAILPLTASPQTWDQWKHYFDEADDGRTNTIPPPRDRLIRERYVHTVQEIMAVQVSDYVATLEPKEQEDFLQGQLLVQVNARGRPEIVDLLGNYRYKNRYRSFLRDIKQTRYPKFPKDMRDALIEMKYTIDPAQHRNRIYVRYHMNGIQSQWYPY